jgi:hypothetical protein
MNNIGIVEEKFRFAADSWCFAQESKWCRENSELVGPDK